MENLKKNLNYIGLILILVSFFWLIIWPHIKTLPFILAVAGILCLGVYISLNLSVLKQGFKRKSFLYSSNLLLIIILVLGILVLVNYFFAKHHHRFDFTEAKLHSLSDQSTTVLKNLKNDINIKCFFLDGNYSRGSMENLMQIYSYHSSKIKYEFIDPDKNPGLVKAYEITQDGTTILESGDKESRITTSSEEDITNAVIKVTREEKKIIYFLEGHGEASIEEINENGYSMAKDELGKIGYEVKKISLALSENFPNDLALLIIPGPEKDLLPNELETIRSYIHGGGRIFFMVDPQTAPGLKPFLEEFGIKLEEDLIVDTVSRLLGGDYFMPVVSEYEFHSITEKFRYATFYPLARSIDTLEAIPEGITVEVLAKSGPNSWSERQLDQVEVSFDENKDKSGPIPLAAVITVKPQEKEKEEPQTEAEAAAGPEEAEVLSNPDGRLAVFGDSGFASNQYFNFSGNGNFFLNIVNWLTEEADLISIQPKTSSPRALFLTPSQARLILYVSQFILPLAVLLTGISVWLRRRKL
jgi:ABC-type uncharacterized transport system involved in gliding motility auxiliary subunit